MLNEALKQIRLFHRMRQNDLAQRLGISNSYLSEIEKGKKSPSVDIIDKYANIFNISSSSIFLFSEKISNGSSDVKANASHMNKILRIMQWITEGLDDAVEVRKG